MEAKEAVKQILDGIEAFADIAASRAVDRALLNSQASKEVWVSALEASEVMGYGWTPEKVKDLCNKKLLTWERLDPDNERSHIRIWKPSIYEFMSRRVASLKG
jgi:hypothetical protein